MKHLTILIGLFCVINSFGQGLHDEVTKVFCFYPHKLTNDEQKALYTKLDKFYEFVITNKAKYLDSLRSELRRNDNNPYFYYDGGILLLEISKDINDIQLVADALVKADIKDLSPGVYLQHIFSLSLQGANVIDAALHMLDDSSFQVYIPQHALSLKYGESLQFILPRYYTDLYIDKLISKFNLINSTENKITCLDLFIYANCCKADNFMSSFSNDSQQPQKIRDQIIKNQKLTTVTKNQNIEKYAAIFEERKAGLNRISDEALNELNEKTLEMRKNYDCEKK